jgi:hypothetical protein
MDIIFSQRCVYVLNKLYLTYSAISATIAQLRARKQRYKLTMFTRLYRILLGTVVIIAIFFVISSLSFSDRLAEGRLVFPIERYKVSSVVTRLRREILESAMVAIGWLPRTFISLCVRRHRVLVASNPQ